MLSRCRLTVICSLLISCIEQLSANGDRELGHILRDKVVKVDVGLSTRSEVASILDRITIHLNSRRKLIYGGDTAGACHVVKSDVLNDARDRNSNTPRVLAWNGKWRANSANCQVVREGNVELALPRLRIPWNRICCFEAICTASSKPTVECTVHTSQWTNRFRHFVFEQRRVSCGVCNARVSKAASFVDDVGAWKRANEAIRKCYVLTVRLTERQ